MNSYKEKAINILKSNHYRITKPRQLVIELLETSEEPLSPYEIKDFLDAKKTKIDVVSIYRIIKCLEDNHLVHKVMSSNKVIKCQIKHESDCQIKSHHHCHHLLICQKCGVTTEAHCSGVEEVVKSVEKSTNFKIKKHNIEFYGICSTCS